MGLDSSGNIVKMGKKSQTRNNATEKVVAFVLVRLNSSRFSKKHLRQIGDRPLLQWVIDHLKESTEFDKIVITTVAEEANIPLQDFAAEQDIGCYLYEGEADHVTSRLRKAAEDYNADICVLVSGDCPLVYAPAIDSLVRHLKNNKNADHIEVLADKFGRPPALYGIGVARKKAWQLADTLSDRPELKEHHFPIIGLRPDKFNTIQCSLDPDLYFPFIRLFVDTWADLEFMNVLHNELTKKDKKFTLPDVLKLLQEKNELLEINAHVYQRQMIEDIKKVLFFVDAGGNFGYGHLMRCLELGLQITERLSWPVAFVVDDPTAKKIIADKGIKVFWGAIDRTPSQSSKENKPVKVELIQTEYDLIIIDIFGRRDLTAGWKEQMFGSKPVVAIDKVGGWSQEADMAVVPGVTLSLSAINTNAQPMDSLLPGDQPQQKPKLLAGQNYIIVRRDILQAKNGHDHKDLDFLVYLHPQAQKQVFLNFAERHDFSFHLIEKFDESFGQLLSRARFFLANFGYSFYEALALQAYPINWPLTSAHRADSLLFYSHFGLKPIIIDNEKDIENILSPLRSSKLAGLVPILEDGTPNIVAATAELIHQRKEL